ncbi:MAG TPA: ribonuclease HI family protein [Ignavibacteria bacterium]|nr:ribonuclease H [Bacteroidota bacterium]HRE09535.1 ribonuclease HI family protein [Ignavibacteria bacterium]HRF64445.1 ribonuclease HI family protein [Ignavibacteria bacterium]HRJ04104.1 ribonuclease HI family protein [Ignavibacteria bacterium]HRJ85800.1 ribonuclease HI family protein [Ignavibacteria bacterium]
MARVKVYTDGAARGNPGEAGIGIVIYDENENIIKTWNEYIGKATNNQAEYLALIKSLDLLKELKESVQIDLIEFFADSELMVKQLRLEYKVKDEGLKTLFKKFNVLMNDLKIPYKINHIERKLNKEADKLANMGIDNKNSL